MTGREAPSCCRVKRNPDGSIKNVLCSGTADLAAAKSRSEEMQSSIVTAIFMLEEFGDGRFDDVLRVLRRALPPAEEVPA